MKILPKSLLISCAVAAGVYLVVATRGYLDLVAHQPPHQVGVPMPPDATSFPPYVAWIYSIFYFLVAFVFTFLVAYAALNIRAAKHRTGK